MSGFGSSDSSNRRTVGDKRSAKRVALGLKGNVFLPESSLEADCEIIDISADGAGLRCSVFAPVGRKIVLFADCFGRFEGVVTQRNRMRIGVQFQSSLSRKRRTTEQLTAYLANGMTSVPQFRSTLRAKELPPVQHFMGADGHRIACEIVNIALSGALLKTTERPEVGADIHFGDTPGRVVRHTNEGVAIEFAARRHFAANAAHALSP